MCRLSCSSVISNWRLWIRPAVMTVYALVIVVLLPILIVNAVNNGFTKNDQGSLIGGVFVMMALPISFWEITQHMVHYTKPSLQKHIIRILWMVPIYAVNAWLGLVFPEQSIYVDSLRECYEAYVIYNFMVYLLNYLNSELTLEANLEMKPQVNHLFPFCCLTPWEMGHEFVHMCKHGILQYTVVRPVTTFISFVCELAGVYGEGEFHGNVAFPYMIAINNFSQFIAMYCLVLFYQANKDELKPMQPIGKFLCIKAVVFFSFFQGVLINILVFTGVISSTFDTSDSGTIKDISNKLQDFLICIEMFLAAVAHHYSFSYKPYVNTTARQQSCCSAFLAMWDISDVQRDIKEHLGVVGSSLSRHIRGRSMYRYAGGSANESSRLLVPEPVPGPEDFYNSAPARLGTDGVLSSYDSMAQSETAAEASSYHEGKPRQDSVGPCRKDDEPLIEFSPDNEEPKHNLHSYIA
ncbi:Transmembrane protein 184C [Cryptotermes secundus]|uniref:Transmembrane protein 184C n=1 Tax=Cryptotermes secundus TaxID=105785 RepID=A0A2J7RG46_9NEOP|nr:transmembrane protein 184C isoform X1 [Cryptotermes secundus]PNF39809.1 Transmembrane protein 184C [Cryptotermes secundus]